MCVLASVVGLCVVYVCVLGVPCRVCSLSFIACEWHAHTYSHTHHLPKYVESESKKDGASCDHYC